MTFGDLSAASWRGSMVCASLAAAVGCTWARPVTYQIPPGLSASFTPSQMKASETYAKTFCSVLGIEFGHESWGGCDQYVDMPSAHPAEALGAIRNDWILLRLPGFGAQCFDDITEAFKDAGQHLSDKHGIESRYLPLEAFDTTEQNAIQIRTYMLQQPASARFIVVAHSKGAADVMTALVQYPDKVTQIKAVITVAGAVGGSWVVDRLERLNANVLSNLSLNCPSRALAASPNAIDSMRRKNRHAFAATHEHLSVPAFSISAVSKRAKTSKILRPLWDRVAPYAREQDSHIVEHEAIVPGGIFLGRALGDHWAVAMPFDPNDKVKESIRRNLINHNKFPRAALVEAAVRIAVKKLPN